MRNKGKYDLTIKDNHNYMVGGSKNGIIIHNSPETTAGGLALKFYSSIRVETRRKEFIGGTDQVAAKGIVTGIKNVKNKVAMPFKKGEVKIIFGKGFQVEEEYIEWSLNTGVIERKGTWYFYGDLRLGQGMDKAIEFLKSNPKIYEEVINTVKNRLNPIVEIDNTIKEEIITEEDVLNEEKIIDAEIIKE